MIDAIYPPEPVRVLPGACYSCKGDVRTDRGFVDTVKPAYQSYLCARCGSLALPRAGMAAELIQAAQDRYRNSLKGMRDLKGAP